MCERGAMKALKELLLNYTYHPILWSLYYTCRALHALKPKPPFSKGKIEKYVADKPTLEGSLEGLRDTFFVDDRKKYTWCELYVSQCVLIIPKEWVHYIMASNFKVGEVDEGFELFLQPVRFCCRSVIMYKEPTVVRCESIMIDARRKIHREMYHTAGIDDCGTVECGCFTVTLVFT